MNQSRGGNGRGNFRGRCQDRGGNWLRGRGKFFNSYGRGNWSKNQNNNQQKGSHDVNSNHVSSSQRNFSQATLHINCPYKGWKYYFADEYYSDTSSTVNKVKLFEVYIKARNFFFKLEEIEHKKSFSIDAKDLLLDTDLIEKWSTLSTDIIEMPEKILNCLGLAIHQVFSEILEEDLKAQHAFAIQEMDIDTPQPLELADNVPMIHARLCNVEPIIALKNLKANLYGKFVTIKGTVIRVGNVKPLCTKMAFECNTCGQGQVVTLPDGKYILPSRCSSSECKGRTFNPQRSSHLTETVDWQKIRVQEIIVDDMRETGRIPRIVECELTNDLVDSCVPGDIISISGIVKVTSSDEGIKKSNQDKCMFLLYIFANSLVNNKGKKTIDDSISGFSMEFSTRDYYAIQEIQADPNLFKLLVASLCPAIYGHEMVKAGLILGLFGGTQKFANDRHNIPIRGDPHILIVGDPGLGKSQMLQSAANIAPRGVYVCGNTTSTSGLTVTLSKEGSGGDCALEAGALVLADQGCCCIDEFDKMGNQHQALLEAMEQQSISIAKAGIVCSLPARTSILAAANPVGGHYNRAKTVSENLKLGSALLSRFDLVFILMDKPDEDVDSLLTEHVMALHSGRKKSQSKSVRSIQEQSSQTDESRSLWEVDKPLSERLKYTRGETFDPIPPQLLRKYIAYSRIYVRPNLSQEAAKVLQEFYLDLRKKHQTMDSTPITTRQLESMIRLSEARARLELREKVSQQDAKDIVEITKYSMVDTYCDGFGNLDFLRSQHGSGMSSRGQAKKFISVLSKVAEQTHNSIFTMDQMQQIARDTKIQVDNFNDFISSLNNHNYLIKKGPRIFQLLSTNF